jgi:hypothetical protein
MQLLVYLLAVCFFLGWTIWIPWAVLLLLLQPADKFIFEAEHPNMPAWMQMYKTRQGC